MHRGGRWVDPPRSHQGQRGKRPQKHRTDNEPPNKISERESEQTPSKLDRAEWSWAFSHLSG
jgi:hypothetical protein